MPVVIWPAGHCPLCGANPRGGPEGDHSEGCPNAPCLGCDEPVGETGDGYYCVNCLDDIQDEKEETE